MHEDVSAGDADDDAADVERAGVRQEVQVGVLPPARVRRSGVDVHVERILEARHDVYLRVWTGNKRLLAKVTGGLSWDNRCW